MVLGEYALWRVKTSAARRAHIGCRHHAIGLKSHRNGILADRKDGYVSKWLWDVGSPLTPGIGEETTVLSGGVVARLIVGNEICE